MKVSSKFWAHVFQRGAAWACAFFLLHGWAAAAEWTQSDVASWVRSEGGRLAENDAGHTIAVDLASTWVRDADLGKLALLSHLQKLNLAHTKITDLGLEHLATLKGVRELNLYYAEAVTENGIAHLKDWHNLEHLNLRGTQVTSRVFEHLAGLTNLRSLDVGFSRIDDSGFEHLASLTKLRKLTIGGNRLSGAGLALLELLPSLVHLDASGIQRVDSGLWGLPLTEDNVERLAGLTRLEVLDLRGATLADLGLDRPGRPDAERAEMKHIDRLATLVHLHTLDLTRLPVSATSLEFLQDLPNLRTLGLGQIPRIDDSIAPLLLAIDKLETLNLAQTSVTDQALERLQQAKELKRLFVGGSKVTQEAAERLRQARPDCAVSWWAKPPETEQAEAHSDP